VVEGENLELTPRWKNAFAEHDETVSGAPGDSNFGELVTAIKQKVEAAKRQMIKEAQIAEEQRIKQARKDAKQKHKDALLQRLAAGNLTPEEEEKIEMELEENLTLEEEEEIERGLQEPSDSLSCTTIASDDASRHEEYAASA
jgi:membrane-associated HD superfamily phosphohydrolase